MTIIEYETGTEFPGKIGRTIVDSTRAWPVPKRARENAPNVLFYVLDDVGYAQLKPFGGLIEAPIWGLEFESGF
jgi:arylsulfatase